MNAWYWRCSVKGASAGKLAGKRIALKDNIFVAGVPMMNGSLIMEGYIPDTDATIVTRILDAGGEIVGKAVCENMSFSGGSVTAANGPLINPHSPGGKRHSAGGSSSGSAALVASGDCDMAIGVDQGGSIGIPSSLCGVLGLKPTYGLVPYTGIFPVDSSIDHAGPICRPAYDTALLLEVIAGRNPLDPRRQEGVPAVSYTLELNRKVEGLKLGLAAEGFAWPSGDPNVDDAVRNAAHWLEKLGARIQEVSIPLHRDGNHLITPI